MLLKTTIAGFMTALMALCVPVVYADTGDVKSPGGGEASHQDGDWHHGQKDNKMAEILNLTEDQQKQLKEAHQKQKEAKKTVFEQIKANRTAFDTEITKAAVDMAKINDIQAQLKTIQAQMVDNHLNSILEIKKIMTPEQFAGYMALEKQEDMKKHEGHDGHKNWGDKKDEADEK